MRTILWLVFALALGDSVSTYLCLTTPDPGYAVWEGNPLSAWVFEGVGLITGLILILALKSVGLVVLYQLTQTSRRLHYMVLVGMSLAVLVLGYANLNNWYIWSVVLS